MCKRTLRIFGFSGFLTFGKEIQGRKNSDFFLFFGQNPKIHLFSNVTGKEVTKGADAKSSAVLHLTHPVLWTDEEAVLANIISVEGGVESWSVIEPGPGKVLSGLWGQTEFGAALAASPINTNEAIAAL